MNPQLLKNYFVDKIEPLWKSRDKLHGDSWIGRTKEKGIFCQIERKIDRLYNSVWLQDVADSSVLLDEAQSQAEDLVVYALLLCVCLEQMKKND